jgi:hypothetical protein
MENVISGPMLNTIGWLIGWKTLFSVSAFYMQRLHHENPNMRGSSLAGPMLMSAAANVMSWCTLALTVYVWYRLGWTPALAFFLIPFVLAMIVENVELFGVSLPDEHYVTRGHTDFDCFLCGSDCFRTRALIVSRSFGYPL